MVDIPRNRENENKFTAYLDYYLEFPSYLGSYKRSFDILVENVLDKNFHIDHIAYPILFLARHCMELGFKANIRYFSKYSGKNDYVKAQTHDLEKLFQAFKMHVNDTFLNLKNNHGIVVEKDDKRSFKELCDEVDKLNNIFHQLDEASDAFRYPVDNKDKPSFEKGQRINVIDVNELLERSMLLFNHTADVFAKYTNYADELNSYYEDLMRETYEQNSPY